MGNDYFCINKCLAQQLHCLWIVLRCLWYKNIEKTINDRNHCIFKQTWPKFQNMIIFTHFIHFSYLGTRFRNFAFNLEPTSVQILQFDQDAGVRVGFTLLRFFEKFTFPCWLLLLNQCMAPISSLTWHLKKSGKGKYHNCLDLFAFWVALPMLRFFFADSAPEIFNKNSSSILKSISMR